jgi:hypothetical protein
LEVFSSSPLIAANFAHGPVGSLRYRNVERTLDLSLFIPQKRALRQSRELIVRQSQGYMANVDVGWNLREVNRTRRHFFGFLNAIPQAA